jgi:hypothetical protein
MQDVRYASPEAEVCSSKYTCTVMDTHINVTRYLTTIVRKFDTTSQSPLDKPSSLYRCRQSEKSSVIITLSLKQPNKEFDITFLLKSLIH